MSRWVLWSVVVSAVLGAGACGPSLDEFVAARADKARAVLSEVAQVRDLAQAALPVEEGTRVRDPGPVALCDLLVESHRDAGCTTWVTELDQLQHPRTFQDPEPLVRFGLADWLVVTTSLLETGRFPPSPGHPEGLEDSRVTLTAAYAFGWLLSVKHVVVVRPGKVVAPVLAEDQKSYIAGSYEGDALVYALGAGKPTALGGVRLAYAMEGDVELKMWRGQLHQAQLDRAFAQGVRQALVVALARSWKQMEAPAGRR